jgi:hypothetical protein
MHTQDDDDESEDFVWGHGLVLEYKIVGKLDFVTAEGHARRIRTIKDPFVSLLLNFRQVCMYVCMYVYMCLCVCVYVYVYLNICI